MPLQPIDDDITDVEPTFEVEEQADGSAIVNSPEDDETYESPEFGANLAEVLDSTFLRPAACPGVRGSAGRTQ